MRTLARRVGKMGAVAGTVLSLSCGGDKDAAPTQPVVPAPSAPAAQSTPTPEPPLSASCKRLPMGSSEYRCRDDAATFIDDVSDAIRTLKNEQPEIFDGEQVLNVGAYITGVIRILDRKGICADYDGEELGVATSGEFNDQVDILTANNRVRDFFIGTCYPSVIPVNRPLMPAPNGCSLPSSREQACGDPDSQYRGVMSAAVEKVMQQKPALFDFSQRAPGQDWPLIVDLDGYYRAVIAELTSQGYCAFFDGEEIQMKRTNAFTEHFDINYQDRYVRNGPGIYRGACYPAAF